MTNRKFTEIHSPKLLGTSSESGASVFPVNYFEKTAYLAQSPQLYKQMMINADHQGVFEIGPVFRAENAQTNSHLCEFTGLDLEMALTPPYVYREIINELWGCLIYMFNYVETNNKKELEYFNTCHKYDKLIVPNDPVIISFLDGVKLLTDAGYVQANDQDISTENERLLGGIMKEKYGSDLFVLEKYPSCVRPFYTMADDADKKYSKSYDFIMRGREICSGAQRVHNYNELLNKIKEVSAIEPFEDYLDSFKYGSKPHGGGGFGLERIVMLYFDLKNVRYTSLFPRDPHRLTP